jgi:hypothetical protein
MKFSRIYIFCILLFLLLVFLSEYRMPKHFRWEPTFSHADKQPFGCYVLDSILSASLPQGYTVNSQTLYQMRDLKQPHGILLIADEMSEMTKTDVKSVLTLAEKGHRLLLVTGSCGHLMEDTLRCHSYQRGSSMPLVQYAKKGFGRDTIEWFADHRYERREYRFYPQLLNHEMVVQTDSIACGILSSVVDTVKSNLATAVTFPMGKGSITWVCTPLIFTNFGILDANNHEYIFRLLTETGGLPVIRTEAYGPAVQAAEQTPLRFIISQRPLRWALYLSLLVVLLSMIFGFRRRQRVIPVVEKPQNHLLEFVQLIGTLYYQRRDCRDELLQQSNKYKKIWKKTTKKESLSPNSQNE